MPASDSPNTARSVMDSSLVDAAIWLIALVAMGATLWFSLGPQPPGDVSDKDLHAFAYFITTLAILLAVVWRPDREDRRLKEWSIPIAASVLVVGGLLEIAQGFVDRDAEVSDWVADAIGVALASLIFALLRSRLSASSSV